MASALDRLSERDTSSSPVVAAKWELEQARRDVVFSAHELRDDLKALTDWRRPIRRSPWLFVGSAFALGLVLGALHHSRGTP